MPSAGKLAAALTIVLVALGSFGVWSERAERQVAVVVPGGLVRGAWQRPSALRRLLERHQIRTIVTLTAINRDDPKYVEQAEVVRGAGVAWAFVAMRGSRATLDEMGMAADLLADPANRPVFFHCVGGHHRTSLAQAAFRIRHQGWTADRAWAEIAALPWTRPEALADGRDRRLIEAFAARESSRPAGNPGGVACRQASGPPPSPPMVER